jgi:recombination protein RecA
MATRKTSSANSIKKVTGAEAKRNKWLEDMSKTYSGPDKLKKASEIKPKEVVSTGYENLDSILGIGGFPIGAVIELFGPEASGKGVLSMKLCVAAQKVQKKCLWIDLEHQANALWMETNGLDTSKLDVLEPDWAAESVLEELDNAIKTGYYSLIVIDSVAALQPKHDKENPVGETQVGRLAKVMSDAMKKVTESCAMHKCTAVFINQTREKIGVMYGDPTTTPGGKALKFYASMRWAIAKVGSEKIEKNGELIGCGSKVKTVKNRFAMPSQDTIIPIYYIKYNPSPIDKLVDLAKSKKIITKYKGHYRFDKVHQSEKIEELFQIIFFADSHQKFAKDLEAKLKLDNESITDAGMKEALEAMSKEDFDIEKYNQGV